MAAIGVLVCLALLTAYLTDSKISASSASDVGYDAVGHPQIIPPRVRGEPCVDPLK
jgi:hypothetical protein